MPVMESQSSNFLKPFSPIPIPDQSVFESRETFHSSSITSDKKKIKTGHNTSISKPQCPSPPSKSPPTSRLGLSQRNQLYTPNAQAINFDVTNYKTPSSNLNLPPQTTPQSAVRTPLPDQENYFDTEFVNLGNVGKGSFAEVFAVKSRSDNRHYAIKKKRKQYRGLQDRERAIREYQTGKSISQNPNCLQYYSAWEEKGYLYIQTELCKQTLLDLLDDSDVIPEDMIWKFILDLALGLQHIHKNGIIHFDIKPENILIGFDGSLKIGDFGLSIKANHWRPGVDMEGDFRYMAPELLKEGLNDVVPTVDYGVDVFSLGCTIFEIASNISEMPKGSEPWSYLRSGQVSLSEIPNAPPRSQDLQRLIRQMLHPDPIKRITIRKLLRHKKITQLIQSKKNLPLVSPIQLFGEEDEIISATYTMGRSISSDFMQTPINPEVVNEENDTSMEDDEELANHQLLLSFERSAELERKQREQQRRESLETDMNGKIPNSNPLDETAVEMADSMYPPIHPRKLSFDF